MEGIRGTRKHMGTHKKPQLPGLLAEFHRRNPQIPRKKAKGPSRIVMRLRSSPGGCQGGRSGGRLTRAQRELEAVVARACCSCNPASSSSLRSFSSTSSSSSRDFKPRRSIFAARFTKLSRCFLNRRTRLCTSTIPSSNRCCSASAASSCSRSLFSPRSKAFQSAWEGPRTSHFVFERTHSEQRLESTPTRHFSSRFSQREQGDISSPLNAIRANKFVRYSLFLERWGGIMRKKEGHDLPDDVPYT